jgi:hypothetical protein
MIDTAHLRAKAAEYRAYTQGPKDPRTRDQLRALADYLDKWAAEIETPPAPLAARPSL